MTPKFSVATFAAILLLSGQSYAADLGGNCCADLEGRIAELEATTARKGNRKVTLEVSGQINEAVVFSDGEQEIVNNPNSGGRFRLKGSSKINGEWSAGYLMEFGVDHNADADQVTIRHQALYLKSAQFGTVWLGHSSDAADGIVEMDLSNASVATTLANSTAFDGGIMDGGRSEVIRYISPAIGGFVISASTDADEAYDLALRYAGELSQFRFIAGVAHQRDEKADKKITSGSASLMHIPSGVFLSAMAGMSEGDNILATLGGTEYAIPSSEVRQWGLRLGIEKKAFAAGKTTVYGEYSDADIKDFGHARWYGVGVVQSIDAASMDIYAAYRNLEIDTTAGGKLYDDHHVVVGAMIKF
jgi:predicted porin